MRAAIAVVLASVGCVYPSCGEWYLGGGVGISETCRELRVGDWGPRPVLVGITYEQRNWILAQIRGLGISVSHDPGSETAYYQGGAIFLPWYPGHHPDPAFETIVLTHELQHAIQRYSHAHFYWLYTNDDGYRAWHELEAYSAQIDVGLAFGMGYPPALDWHDHWFISVYRVDTPPAVLESFEEAFARKRAQGRITAKASALVLQWIVDYNEARYGA